MDDAWTVRADPNVEAGCASVPRPWFSSAGAGRQYVALTCSNQTELFPVKERPVDGTQIRVAPRTFGLTADEEVAATWQALTASQYRRFWLMSTPAGRLLLFGLLVALLGQTIAISIEVGKAWTLFQFSPDWLHGFDAISKAMTAVGLVVAFIQALQRP